MAIAVWFVVALAGGYFLISRVNNPYRTMQPLDVPAYLESANSLRGNTYKMTGTIWNSLAWSPVLGRLFSVEVPSASGGVEVLPVLIPADLNRVNIQKGQRFQFKVEVNENGLLLARDLNKE